jgi:hypothetical protein
LSWAGSRGDALAERAGVPVEYVDRLIDLGFLTPTDGGSPFSNGDVRRIRMVHGLEDGGLPLDGMSTAVRNGDFSFGFLDLPAWDCIRWEMAGVQDEAISSMAS